MSCELGVDDRLGGGIRLAGVVSHAGGVVGDEEVDGRFFFFVTVFADVAEMAEEHTGHGVGPVGIPIAGRFAGVVT